MKNIANKIYNNTMRSDDRRDGHRERRFRGYYVDVPPGGDAIKAYRKIKRMMKENRVFEEMRERETFTPRSAKRREARKQAMLAKRRATRRWVEEAYPWTLKRKK